MRRVDIQFPAAGVVRRTSHIAGATGKGPFPAPWSSNVRLEDILTKRLRGGSFTGQSYSVPSTSRYATVVTENGDSIVTENGDEIVVGPQAGVTNGSERIWVAAGDDAPSSSSADCLYRARLLRTAGNIIYASKSGDTTNWDYGGDWEDVGRATIFQLSEANEVGEDVKALVPHKDAFLLGFTASETWVLQGDPVTGSLRNVSREVGIVTARAWCKNHDTVYFLSSLGLYSVQADGSNLQALSEDSIPSELYNVTNQYCMLTYNHADRGVYIVLP